MPGMSAQELEARIEKISADIDLQKEVLKKLEHSKAITQRQLNAVRDPVARLPFEISSEIFIQCLPSRPEPGLHHIPMILLNICHTWTEIALSTPALWAAIHIVFPRHEGFKEFLQAWLKRAQNRPLSISLHRRFGDDITTTVKKHSQQIRNLDIYHHSEPEDEQKANVDLLGGLGSLPNLEMLTIRDSGTDGAVGWSYVEAVEALRLAPNLINCTFHRILKTYSIPGKAPQHLVHPHLRQLSFGDRGDYEHYSSDDHILHHLSLPDLRNLTLSPLFCISDEDLYSFFKRSSPPLQELVMTDRKYRHQPLRLDACLRLIPTLTRLELWDPQRDLMEKLFTDLAESPTGFLPALRDLSIPRHFITLSWEAMLRALSVRRTQIAYFRATKFKKRQSYHDHGALGLPPNPLILAAFRELVADGMELRIGTEEQDFI
ncbi:hypothetical protein DFH07DRAFT_283749 [Mycena maculata]|uniref:F-box domain-containing protein n=1 Tax=Mycena maculata TaxID=230809 RepID=A0AAD7HM70_9AGAR|nr:hypothetical protein DFH07DRAFT_283749 [Mycena maculata]